MYCFSPCKLYHYRYKDKWSSSCNNQKSHLFRTHLDTHTPVFLLLECNHSDRQQVNHKTEYIFWSWGKLWVELKGNMVAWYFIIFMVYRVKSNVDCMYKSMKGTYQKISITFVQIGLQTPFLSFSKKSLEEYILTYRGKD